LSHQHPRTDCVKVESKINHFSTKEETTHLLTSVDHGLGEDDEMEVDVTT